MNVPGQNFALLNINGGWWWVMMVGGHDWEKE